MADVSLLPAQLAFTPSHQGKGGRADDEDEQNRQKADSVSKLSKVRAPTTPVSSGAVAAIFRPAAAVPGQRKTCWEQSKIGRSKLWLYRSTIRDGGFCAH
jgi:hypothetical protein